MDASNAIIDGLLLVLLVVAIGVGSMLLWQITILRRERFKFDQMTKALAAQMSIFQSALESGKLDMETKISRMNKAIEKAQQITEEMHGLFDAHETRSAVARQTPPQPSRAVQQPPAMRAQSRFEPYEEEEPSRVERPLFSIVDPEFMTDVKEDKNPAVDDYGDLSEMDKRELAQLATPAEKALMAALKRAGKR